MLKSDKFKFRGQTQEQKSEEYNNTVNIDPPQPMVNPYYTQSKDKHILLTHDSIEEAGANNIRRRNTSILKN
jgi:hypothetical protein